MTKIAVSRPVTTFMTILVFLAFGGMSLLNLRMDLLPNMNIPVAVVFTNYSGASPDQVRRLVTEPIEQSLATLQGLDTLSSTSSEGSSVVIMQFDTNIDIDMAAIDIREAVDVIANFLPDDAGTPMVLKIDVNAMDAIQIAVSSQIDDLVSLNYKVEDQIQNRLARQPGVASVNVSGGMEREVVVELITDRIRGFGITEQQIIGILAMENASMPVGALEEAGLNLTVSVDARFRGLEDIRNIPINTPTGALIYLRDIAEVREVYRERSNYSYLNREQSVNVTVQRQSDANTVQVSNAVMRELEAIRADFPELDISVIMNPADYIENSINAVSITALSGLALAIIVLFTFLRDIRATLVVAAAIPVSIVVTFSFMFFAGMTLNMMSLGGLTLGVGLLVDNSIVVLESVFRRMEKGEDRFKAAINGTREVSMSIVASTITTMSVFVPVAWLGGLIAQIFTDLALSVSFSLGASLLVAITFVPLACSLFLSPKSIPALGEKPEKKRFTARISDAVGKAVGKIDTVYRKALDFATRWRKLVMLFAFIFFVGSLASMLWVGMELLPPADQSMIQIDVNLPSGAVLDRTREVTYQVLDRLESVPEIQTISTSLGGGGFFGGGNNSSRSSILVMLYPMGERTRSSIEVADQLRAAMVDVAGAEISVEAITDMMGGGGMGGGGAVQYNIVGDDIDTLIQVSDDLIALLSQVEGLRDVSSSVAETLPQAVINVDRMRASSFGLTAQNIISAASTSIQGSRAGVLRMEGNELDLRVTKGDGAINDLTELETLLIPSPLGMSIPLREVANIELTRSPLSISRLNQQTFITIFGHLDGRDLGSVTTDIGNLIQSEYIFPVGVSIEPTGNQQFMDEEILNMVYAMIVAIFVVYAIMSAQFESLFYPFIIMFSVPVALSGGLLGLFIAGQTFGITAALGLIVLVGIVTNNAIVLIDYINLLRGKGLSLIMAVQEAATVRLRAILMTTLTTALGLLPMMLGNQEGSEVMQPLATVVIFGLVFSTGVTLLVIPAIYITFENVRTRLFGDRRKFRKIEEV
ncbi:MAG: efflux RND transporter permease subunit [Oscillospiraceae bacterium]|nr:efflux RND transporter permease subunit [Oscillospiraceae bacterium]